MKLLRNLPFILLVLFTLLVVLTGASFVPEVQTAVAQMALGGKEGLHGTVTTFTAEFGKVDLTGLHLENRGAVLTMPSLQAKLPLTKAAVQRKVAIESLVAKGWTLDLSKYVRPESAKLVLVAPAESASSDPDSGAAASSPAAQLQVVGYVFQGLISQLKLPCDLSLDGVDLEGDVLAVLVKGQKATRFHVELKGGGIAAGQEGSLTVNASAAFLDFGELPMELNGQGNLTVKMNSPRTLERFTLKTAFSAKGGSLPAPLAFSTEFSSVRGAEEESYAFQLARESRPAVALAARFPDSTHRLTGTWKIDLRDADAAPFVDPHPLPTLAATGEGEIDSDAAFARIHAVGNVSTVASRLGVIAPPLESLGTATVDTHFDAVHTGTSLRFEHVEAALAGTQRALAGKSLQPFTVDEKTLALTLSQPKNDWIEGSIDGFPLAWLSGLMGRFSWSGGTVAGAFTVKAVETGYAVRPKAPYTVTDVSLLYAGKPLANKLDLSLALLVDQSPQGWQFQLAPLLVSNGGQPLATAEIKSAPSTQKGHPVVLSGKWTADLEALHAKTEMPALPWTGASAAAGDLSANVAATGTKLDSKFVVSAKEADRSIAVNLHTEFGGKSALSFRAPVKVTVGTNVSDLTAEGKASAHETWHRIDVIVTGKDVALEHLRLLATPFASIGQASLLDPVVNPPAGTPTLAEAPDRTPFWGDAMGRLMVAFDRLRVGENALETVRGTFELDHGSIKLKSGVYGPPDKILGGLEGTLTFNATAPAPYHLEGKMADHEIDAAPFFGVPPKGQDPAFKGKFAVTGALKGEGLNLDDLIRRSQQEYQLKSSGGIIRLLKTDVNEAIPDTSTAAGDAVGTAGSLVGKFFGVQHEAIRPNETHLAKNTEATLDFVNGIAEIGYDEITILATRGLDRVIHVEKLTITTPDEDIIGSGEVSYVKGKPFGAQSISLDLKFGARGRIAGILATAGLLSTEKDSLGYTAFNQPVHFGGTLEHLDLSSWHNLLVEAAKRKPEPGKKDLAAAPAKK